VLRPPTSTLPPPAEAATPAPLVAAPSSLPVENNVSAPNEDVQALRDELAKLRGNAEQWTKTEAQWSQQRRLFQMMTDNMSDLIVLLDTQGNRRWLNAAYGHVLGHPLDALVGTHVLTEVHAEDRAKATESLNATLQQGTTQQSEYRVQRNDGDWVYLQVETIGVLDPNGRIESALLLAVDATDKQKLFEALTLANTKASAATAAESMARDFDQVLTNIVGNLTIAKNLNGPHNAIAVRLNEMERSLQRARDLIEQVFSIAPGQTQPRVEVALEPAVQEAVGDVLRGTMIRPEYLFPRNLPTIEVDPEGLAHAIRNVVANAVQAMDKGVIRFSAESIPHTQFSYRPDLPLKVGDYVCLHVQDQGHGISDKSLSRIFEPYFTTRSGSQGLGLTTALSAMQRMGGTIVVESTPGVGTNVAIYFPATGYVDAPAPGMSSTGSLPKSHSPSRAATSAMPKLTGTSALPRPGHKRRILLMDDEQMILDIVSRMLGHLGYEVTTCTDGSQAIAAFAKAKSQNEPFDVVMMDLVIPNGVGGQDAVHTIKQIDPNARVLASSGHLEHPVMVDHKKFGFNAVLEKPYKLEKLQQVIEAVVNAPAT
jgi:two-component system cell cycle sensor histidine kinase/response regulator CckA